MNGITGITRNKVALTIPPDTPSDELWRYGLGFPFQIAPRKAGLFCNIRRDGTNSIDLEIGTDVVLFDNLETINAGDAIAISRYEMTETSITRKGPVLGGFVPLGAKLIDGSPHPHAGTGFGLAMGIRHMLDDTGNYDYREDADRHAELFQFGYDGNAFKILRKEFVKVETLLSEWDLAGNFVTNAIPDGQDLLYVMIARVGGIPVSGVSRWQYSVDGWRPVSFVPITGNEAPWSEPSLIRDANGDLLFSARSDCSVLPGIAFDAAVWRSTDNGRTWEQVIYRKDCRSRSPVSINQAADGTPFLAANLPPHDRTRAVLAYWPLNESRTDFEKSLIARDAPTEFGPAPSGSWWRIDHPNSAIIRLADGAWHSLLVYRIVDNGEVEGDADPAPQTGCYVEEVLSSGKVIPTWNF
ncbi:MAG: glycoside hydrolase [Actinomycetia bacterium]|nr:glycoside hydrolase [Actinomycetes bacterium]